MVVQNANPVNRSYAESSYQQLNAAGQRWKKITDTATKVGLALMVAGGAGCTLLFGAIFLAFVPSIGSTVAYIFTIGFTTSSSLLTIGFLTDQVALAFQDDPVKAEHRADMQGWQQV